MPTEVSRRIDVDQLAARLTEFGASTLALMHGPSFSGDGAAALRALADDYDRRVSDQMLAFQQSAAA